MYNVSYSFNIFIIDTVKGSVFIQYFKSGNNWFYLFMVFSLFIIAQAIAIATDFWTAFW